MFTYLLDGCVGNPLVEGSAGWMIHQDPKNPICPKQLKQLQKKALQRGIMITFVAVGLLSLWLCIAHQFGWLTGGVTRTTAAWIGQMTPAVSAWLMHRIGQGEGTFYGFRRPTLKWLFWGWILGIGLPSAAFGVTGMFGWGSFASSWSDVMENIREQGFVSLSSDVSVLLVYALFSLSVVPLLLTFCALGEEIGWRGYLLSQLLVFGRRRALLLSGLLWSVWYIPLVLVGQAYPGHPVAGLLLVFPFITGVGVILGHLQLSSQSVWIPSLAHGTFNAQMAGPAAVLVSASSPVTGGFMGVAGILVIWPIALWLLWKQ
jgi:membrane protease YdiL (CAAX protease family)